MEVYTGYVIQLLMQECIKLRGWVF